MSTAAGTQSGERGQPSGDQEPLAASITGFMNVGDPEGSGSRPQSEIRGENQPGLDVIAEGGTRIVSEDR